MSSNKKSIVDFIPHPRNFDPLDIIHSILKEKPKKEEAIIAIESCIPEFEAYQNLKMQEINNYVKSHPDRCDFSSVGTIGKICAEKIALLKKALSVIKKEGIHGLKEWLYKEFIEKEKRERYLDSIYPSMKNIKEEKNNLEGHEGNEGQDELKIDQEQFIGSVTNT